MDKYTNQDYRICSTGKNESGRTVFVQYRIRNGIVKSIHSGELLDSQEDRDAEKKMTEWRIKLRREFLLKQHRSEQSAKNGSCLTAAA